MELLTVALNREPTQRIVSLSLLLNRIIICSMGEEDQAARYWTVYLLPRPSGGTGDGGRGRWRKAARAR